MGSSSRCRIGRGFVRSPPEHVRRRRTMRGSTNPGPGVSPDTNLGGDPAATSRPGRWRRARVATLTIAVLGVLAPSALLVGALGAEATAPTHAGPGHHDPDHQMDRDEQATAM